jgi:hypothetical protein
VKVSRVGAEVPALFYTLVPSEFPRTHLRETVKSLGAERSVVLRETNTLLPRAIWTPYTGQITVETLLKNLFSDSLFRQ